MERDEVIIGGIYAWDLAGVLYKHGCHPDTKTVKLLNMRTEELADVESVETKELFYTNIGHLTTISRTKEIINNYKKKVNNVNFTYNYHNNYIHDLITRYEFLFKEDYKTGNNENKKRKITLLNWSE